MLKSYLSVLWRRGALCHTMSPHGLIPPPIKRSRILVSDGVVILISVKLYLWLLNVWLRRLWLRLPCRKIPVSRHPPPCAQPTMLLSPRTSSFSLPAFTSNLSFLSNCFTLYSIVDCEMSVRLTLNDLMFDTHFCWLTSTVPASTISGSCAALTPGQRVLVAKSGLITLDGTGWSSSTC